jgi:hypothetical protein
MRLLLLFALLVPSAALAAPRVVVDSFEDVKGWSAQPADGVELKIGQDEGVHGKSLRLDFHFVRGGGYAVARKAFALDLPPNYRFHFAVRGDTKPQDLEFKLVDSTGSNVWWMNRRNFTYPAAWDSLTTKKRQIEFAWGPQGGGEIRHIASIEIAITAGSGGKGTVWLDDLTLEELPPADAPLPRPSAQATSSKAGHGPEKALDGESLTSWQPAPGDTAPALTIDYGVLREFSAVLLDWNAAAATPDYVLERSDDGASWRTVHEVRDGRRGRNWIFAPESEARYLRIRLLSARPAALDGLRIEEPAWAKNANEFYRHVADGSARGLYPRGMSGEQPYWTVIGDDGAVHECLMDEDGRIEPWKAGPSIEPFLFARGRLWTWADAKRTQSLADSNLPIPSVTWNAAGLELEMTAFVGPEPEIPNKRSLYVRYRLRNSSRTRVSGTFWLAMRPFQVNPPAQFLNTTGGVAPLKQVRVSKFGFTIGSSALPLPPGPIEVRPTADVAFAAGFDQGDLIADFVSANKVGKSVEATDVSGRASGALGFKYDLAPAQSRDVELKVWQLDGIPDQASIHETIRTQILGSKSTFDAELTATLERWRALRGDVILDVPPSGRDAIATLRAQLAYARVTRDMAALMPGTRSYERSWIRDGALSANGFLRMGQPEVAKEFARWFAGYVPPDGAVPCCVDHRGADPTPEHDSHGEFVYLVAEILRYTGDLDLARDLWPAARRAADHIDTLRAQRRTPEWRNTEFFGLLPPSISHEGYSAKPMHSYWDDFFGLRGLADATYLAERLGHADDAKRFAASRDEFGKDLKASIAASQKKHGVDYVPGCADMGDFDATSTTIALDPVDAEDVAGKANLDRTFDLYWEHFTKRRDGPQTWNDYTPYETRTIGALARLGFRDRANEALTYFLKDRRPKGFMHWAEVVGREERKPRFIGDMPHTWVGTDYVRSVIDLFVYTRGADSALVVGSGLPRAWVADRPGVRVAHLPTPFGPLAYRMNAAGARTVCELDEGLKMPAGGIVVAPPPSRGRSWRAASIDGTPATLDALGRVTVNRLPARVVFEE